VGGLARFAALLALLIFPAAARADWREAETAHFRIFSGGGEQQLVRFAERLEMLDALLRKLSRAPQGMHSSKVRVILLDREDQVRRAYSGTDPNVAGFYTVNMHGPLAVSPRRTDEQDSVWGPEIVLFHEYAHHFMLEYFPAGYPSWYVEGFAEIVSTAAPMAGEKMAFGKAASHRQYSLMLSRWIPVEQLLTSSRAEFPKDADFYGQSWVLAHYLTFSRERNGQIYRYLGALASGRPPLEAAREIFGDLGALNREVRNYLSAQSFPYSPIEVAKPPRDSISLRPLGTSEAALMEETAAFRDSLKEDRRAAYLADLRAKTARFPTDPYALQLLADAEYAAEDFPASRATVDRLLAIAPQNVHALTRKATILLREAEDLQGAALDAKVNEARKLIVAANRRDADDPQTLIAFYESYRVSGERPPAVAVEGLKQAVGTVPQDFRPRMMLANQLANEGKYQEAIFYLGPIAYDPHSSEGQQAALAFIKRLRERAAAATSGS
jgi:cytochrome c-type biogenesis protein CcmH/NrfG